MKLYLKLFSVLVFLFISACSSDKNKSGYKSVTTSEVSQIGDSDGYVGAQTCKECHQDYFSKWEGSHHDLAMQIADSTTVLGNFNDHRQTIDGVDYHFYKNEGHFFVKTEELDQTVTEYQIKYTFGVDPLQQYLIDFEGGRKQVLRASWNVIEQQWFHQYDNEKIQPNDWLHWTRGAQNWNTMCAECHSTNLKKNYSIEHDTFNTSYSEISVSCESCHGAGNKHVLWATSDGKEGSLSIIKGNSQFEQMNLCAPCHARRVKLTENLVPGENFNNQYMVQNISNQFYHKDGQIDEEDYVYGSFLQSKMYANGVKCNDCHNVHSLKLKHKGNKLCMQCHEDIYDTKQHHFHQESSEGASCINCHMTGKVYMGNDFRRDHSFRIPRPDQSEAYGTPNACTECHKDKSNTWAATKIKSWYGTKRQTHFSDQLLTSNKDNITAREQAELRNFINDLNYPFIARSTVIENMALMSREDYQALLESLNDPMPQVRYNALQKFRQLPLQDRLSIAAKHVTDTSKLVRIGVGQLTYGIDNANIPESQRNSLNSVRQELEKMLYANADFASGRMQLGDYYLQNNDVSTAIKHYEIALKKDSLLLPVYSNLATAYSMQGSYTKAFDIFSSWIKHDTENSRIYYLRALLNFELKHNEQAVSDLKRSITLDPTNTRALYNLATYYYQSKEFEKAKQQIKKAVNQEPQNNDFKYLLALIYKEQGNTTAYNILMKQLPQQGR